MSGPKLPVVMPLIAACALIIVAIPWVASRGRVHMPGYGGGAILAFACGILLGHLSGVRGITGTVAGVSLAVAFFLMMAVAAGCLFALFCYRPPLEE
jgi:hypothetical protein